MSLSWNAIVEEAEGYFEKSGHELSREQKVAKFLKSPRGQQLYAQYRVEGDSIGDLAKEELIVKSAQIARAQGISAHDAMIEAVDRYRDLAVHAGLSKALLGAPVSKEDDAWSRIEAGADAWVQKSGDVDLDQSQAIDRFLKTDEGRRLYAEYRAEREV